MITPPIVPVQSRQAARLDLIPADELSFDMIAKLRNAVIEGLLDMASKMESIEKSRLIVRDILPYTDLGWDYGLASAGTSESWEHDCTTTSVGYTSVIGSTDNAMSHQRYVAIFGVRDLRFGQGATSTATEVTAIEPMSPVSLIKFVVAGSIKAIWDASCLSAHRTNPTAFSHAAVLIPSGVPFNIYLYQRTVAAVATSKSIPVYLQLIGVTVEPRGQVLSP